MYSASLYSGEHGDISTDGGLPTQVNLGPALVYGTVHTGPSCDVNTGPGGGVGSHAWLATNSGIEPGHVQPDSSFAFPVISLPLGDFSQPTGGCTTNLSFMTNAVTTNACPNPLPPGGVQTNYSSVTVSNLPSPIPPGLSTNATTVTSTTLPDPVPDKVITNLITAYVTSNSYPAPSTYYGSVTTNYFGKRITGYSYNLITGATYTYHLYTYTYPVFSYTYEVTSTNFTLVTNCYSYILNPDSTNQTTTLGSGSVLVKAGSPSSKAVLILTGGLTGVETIQLERGARLVVYCDSPIQLIANQIINPNGNADSFLLYGTSNASSLTVKGNGTLTAIIIAPSADMSCPSGGGTQLDFCGSAMVDSLNVSRRIRFHFDESLSGSPVLPPQIVTQPQGQNVKAGDNVTFSVGLQGSGPFTYQWYFFPNYYLPIFGSPQSWLPITDATNNTLTLTNADAGDLFGSWPPPYYVIQGMFPWAGAYRVVISGPMGQLTSAPATLFIHFPPLVTRQPVSQHAPSGSTVSLDVGINGLTVYPYFFQWRLNEANVPAATNDWLVISNFDSGKAGTYDVVISNAYGSVTSQVATVSVAVPPDFLWAQTVSNSTPPDYSYGPSIAQAVIVDSAGTVTVVGTFRDPGLVLLDSDEVALTNPAAPAPMNFLCRYDSFGSAQWGFTAGTNLGKSQCIRVGTDASNRMYLAGNFSGSVTFDTNILVTSNSADMFVAQVRGGTHWARQIPAGDPTSLPFGFAVDHDGNSFIAARDSGTADFGTMALSNSAAFLAKYDSAGNLLWATEALGANAIALGTNGSVYLAGQGVLAKFDNAGNPVWSRDFPIGLAIAADADENLYVTGYGAGDYSDFTLTNTSAGPDFFVARCDSSGDVLWVKQAGSTGGQAGSGICVDKFGDVFVSSLSRSKSPDPILTLDAISLTNVLGFVAEFDPTGRVVCALAAADQALFWDVAGSTPDAIFTAGDFFGTANFGDFTLTDNEPFPVGDMFVARLAGPGPTPAQLASRLSAGNQFQFDVTGAPGFAYIVECSTNLTDWLPVSTNTAPFVFTDSDASSHSFNFYRAVYRPWHPQ